MEDAFSVSFTNSLRVGVFDGHGTSFVAKFVAEQWTNALDKHATIPLNQALQTAFHDLDEQILVQDISGGSTAVCAVLQKDEITVAHCGDSRALLFRNSQVIALTEDHKPLVPKERFRIESAGGFVTMDGRVNRRLSCSRSFGDFKFKLDSRLATNEQLVICQPDVITMQVLPGDLLLLACDGVFEHMTNEQVHDCLQHEIKKHGQRSLSMVASKLLDKSLAKGSRDNMTCVLIEVK